MHLLTGVIDDSHAGEAATTESHVEQQNIDALLSCKNRKYHLTYWSSNIEIY